MALIKVKTAGVDDSTNLGRRNLIMNGDMSVAQRGTSTTTTSGNYAISPDRFRCYTGNYSTSPITASQSTDSPDGFSNSLKYNFDSADATPSHEHSIYYSIEGQDLQHLQKGTANSKSLTLSFWCKASLSGTYIAELMDNDNGSKHINKSYTISSANTWEYKTITFEGDTVGTLDNDTGNSLSIVFWLAANSSNSSGTLQTSWGSLTQANRAVGQTNLGASANNAFYVTGIQLEVGDDATPFEHRSYAEELQACKRYYEKIGNWGNTNGYYQMCVYRSRGLSMGFQIQYTVEKRVDNPSVTWYSPDETTTGSIYRVSDGGASSIAIQYGPSGDRHGVYRTQHSSNPASPVDSGYSAKLTVDCEF